MLTTKIAHNGSTRIVYHVRGCGPAVCLIASTGRGAEDFEALARALVNLGFRVIAPEPRGIGGSGGWSPGIDFHDLAADAAAAISAETDKAIVAGHAFGCWIARTLASDRPDLVRGLALIAAGAGNWPRELSQAIDTAASTEASRADRLSALRLAFFAPGNDPTPWLAGWYGDVIVAQRASRAATERNTWWHSGSAPILDLVGLQDPFRPAADREFYAKEFGSRLTLTTIDGASHALPHEKPTETAEALANWASALD